MTHSSQALPEDQISCSNCQACCCKLEVLLLGDTGVPERFIQIDQWGGMTMRRGEDGWCAALDRNTMLCSIYSQRPLVCREFETGSYECMDERVALLKQPRINKYRDTADPPDTRITPRQTAE